MKKLLLFGMVLLAFNAVAQKAPVALNDTVVVAENSSSNSISVTANDTAYNGQSLSVTIITNPQHGTAAVINNNQVNYMPAAFYYGADSFTYAACDTFHCDRRLSKLLDHA